MVGIALLILVVDAPDGGRNLILSEWQRTKKEALLVTAKKRSQSPYHLSLSRPRRKTFRLPLIKAFALK